MKYLWLLLAAALMLLGVACLMGYVYLPTEMLQAAVFVTAGFGCLVMFRESESKVR